VKKQNMMVILAMLILSSCQLISKKEMNNPLLQEFNTQFGVPPFDLIKNEHFIPAIQEGMRMQNEEIDAILTDESKPDFENTIVALERSGLTLDKVNAVFSNLNSSNTNDTLEQIAREIAPMLTRHNDAIRLNPDLFRRIKAVYEDKQNIALNSVDQMLLEETYLRFVRGGANLPDDKRARFMEINEELSSLSIQFGQNVLAETNNFKMVIEDRDDLSGLPSAVIDAAAAAAERAEMSGKWVFTVHKPSLIPFITYADKRDLREKLFKAYSNLGNNDNENDNKEIIEKIVALRAERVAMLGYETHADFVLDRNMSKTPENVLSFLEKVWTPALKVAKAEADDLQAMIKKEGGDFKLEPWDWWYYSEKVRKDKYDIDEETLREYFSLENVRDGAFEVCNRLFGITFERLTDIPKYHEDVEVFEVKDADGSHIGVIYMDFFPRPSKRSGAWMSSFRKQVIRDGENIRPVVTNNFNFSMPTADKPALISFEEAQTLYHELGHGLHGLLSQGKYASLSGTSVPRDFVELPSQIMENWASDPEVLKMYARHYQTGETIPDEILEKLEKSRHFNQGFATVEYVAASYLDMYYHTLKYPAEVSVSEFEKEAVQKMNLIPEIILRYRSTYFSHIFSGGYSSGYYSYLWAEVLDSDAFMAFKETSLFDPATANAFRTNILEKGGSEDPMKLYVDFRGKEPDIKPLLEKRGLTGK
jgi:peptidyl-dipeptidase Dcp